MGGKSFAKPASRLTTAELDKLTSLCQLSLAAIFSRIERLRCITSKSSHGDLDLLCSFDEPDIRIGSAEVGVTSIEAGKEAPGEEGNVVRVRRFCDTVSAALGADGWVLAFYGYPIIALQVPHTVTSPSGEIEEAFWQVDIALVHPDMLDAYLVTCSYNIVFALLVLACQALSPSLWFKRKSLCLRHRPFSGHPIIQITLIDDQDELWEWLGLDMAVWHAGFDNYVAIYRWITTNPAGSALVDAWNRVAAGTMDGVRIEYKRFHTRIDGVPEFIAWLKANRVVSPSDRSAHGPITSPRRNSSALDSGQELPLDDIVIPLLKRSGQLKSYSAQVEPIWANVLRIVANTEKRKANKEKAKRDEEAARAKRAALAAEAKKGSSGSSAELAKGASNLKVDGGG